jgi:hypothetical protein
MAAKAKNPGSAPGKKVVTTVEERELPPESPGELELESPDEQGPGDDFADVLADLAGGSEAKCEIRRTSPAEFAGYCCTYAASEMSLDRLAEEWGGGKFNVRVRDSKGVFRGSTSVQIAGKAKFRSDNQTTPVAAAATVQAMPDIGAIMKAAMDSQKPQIDMLTSLVTALIQKPTPTVEKGPDVLEIIGQLAPILKPERASDSGDAVKMLLQGIELGKEFAGGGDGGEPSMMGIASKGLEFVTKMAAAAPARPRPRPQAPRPALAAPVASAVPVAQPAAQPVVSDEPVDIVNPQDPPMLKLLNWIRQQTTLLCYQAARNKDPELYADLFLDNIPADVSLDVIYEQMSDPNALENLAQINPDVRKFPEWMERFRQHVLAGLVDDEQPAPAGDAGPGESGPDAGGPPA